MTTIQGQRTTKQLIPRALRFQINTALRYRVVGEKVWREGWVENVSVTGVLFSKAETIEIGKTIDIRLVLPGARLGSVGGMVVSKGKIVRSWSVDNSFHRVFIAAALVNPQLRRLREAIDHE